MTISAIPARLNNHRRHSRKSLPPVSSSLILLVERELASRLSCANELLDEGYEIVESESASEAMSILDGRNDFDAMIADIDTDHVPGGLALIRYAAGHHPSMKILINSAWTEAEAESNAIAARFLSRPFPAGALIRQMRDLLAPQPAPALVLAP